MKECRKISPRLHALALDEIDAAPAEELISHLSECPSCTETFDDFKQMRSFLGENIVSALACPDIADSVLKRASKPEKAPMSNGFAVRWTRRQFAAAAVIAVLVIAGFFYLIGPFGPRRVVARSTYISHSGDTWVSLEEDIRGLAEISTNARVRRSLRLENGVIVILNENTTLKTRGANQLKLVQGDVYVDTAGHEGLDFRVKTKHATTHVTGTRFSVSANKERTTVIVEEGHVNVESNWRKQAVWAGYWYRVARKTRPTPPEPIVVDEAFSWIKDRRRLVPMVTGAAVAELEEPQQVASLAVEQDSPVVRIFGIIRDGGGEPVADAELQAMEAGSGARIPGAATTTRSDGSFDLGGLQLNNPVPYKIVASAPGYGPALSEEFVFDETPKEVNITLPVCGTMRELPGLSEDAAVALVDAVAGGDFEQVQRLIDQGGDIETLDANGETLLLVAAREAHSEIAQYLIDAGAKVNVTRMDYDWCPTSLIYAARNGDVELVKLLLENDAEVHPEIHGELSALGSAAANGNLEIAGLLLDAGAEVNKADRYGKTILKLAVGGGSREIVKLLLDSGAEIEPKIELPSGFVVGNVVHHAAEKGTPEVMDLLLEYGGDIEKTDERGKTALAYAAQAGNTEMVRFLLGRGAIINHENPESESPLACAARSGHLEVVELLLAKGADVTVETHYGVTPLYSAAFGYSRENQYRSNIMWLLKEAGAQEKYEGKYSNPELLWAVAENDLLRARSLIEKGADVNETGTGNETALSLAAKHGLPEMTIFLLDAGADVAPDESKIKDPLMSAIQRESENGDEIVRLLLDAGADPNTQNEYGSALIRALQNSSEGVLELLLSRGADPNVKDPNGYTPLALASTWGKKEAAELLLDYGADTELGNDKYSGNTPLMNAIVQGHPDIARLLIDRGADVNSSDKYGGSPLTKALYSGRIEILKILLENGAVQTNEKLIPLLIAADSGQTRVVRLLLEQGADPNSKTSRSNYTALLEAVEEGHTAAAELLLACGADPNAQMRGGRTPLMTAAAKGDTLLAKYLVENCADVYAKDDMGLTALILAVGYGRKDTIQFLQEIMGKEESEAQHYFTPLMWAVAKDDGETVKSLLQAGVDVNEKEEYGSTAIDGALLAGNTAMMKLLLDAGAEFDIKKGPGGISLYRTNLGGSVVDIKKGLGELLLFLAMQEGSADAIRLLLTERDVDINYSSGRTTLLMDAIKWDEENMVRLLIELGADVNAICDGRTVLEVAEENGNREIIRFLKEAGAGK